MNDHTEIEQLRDDLIRTRDKLTSADRVLGRVTAALGGLVADGDPAGPGHLAELAAAEIARLRAAQPAYMARAAELDQPTYYLAADARERFFEYVKTGLDIDTSLRQAWKRFEKVLTAFPASPVPAEAGDSTADETRKLTVTYRLDDYTITGSGHGYYHADCPCGWRSVRSDVADVACEWSDHTCTPGFASSVRDTAETARYFVDLDGGGDLTLWIGTGPDDPNCQSIVRKCTLDGQHPVLWPTVVKALTGQADADGGAE